MEDVKNWEIDGDTLTIKITDKVSAKDLSDITNAIVNYERKHIAEYHTKYTYWNVECSIGGITL
jgi:hypothetical protein